LVGGALYSLVRLRLLRAYDKNRVGLNADVGSLAGLALLFGPRDGVLLAGVEAGTSESLFQQHKLWRLRRRRRLRPRTLGE
jgi:hypothetical protein